MADGSTKVVYVALAGNIVVAVAKYAVAALSGSSAMLTEAVHSTADTANQILLLIGSRRSQSPPDAAHPFGYGMEIYFWSLIVAMMVLLAGGGVSLFQGIQELGHPERIEAPWLTLGVLAFSAVFEGASLLFTVREAHRVVRGHNDHPERTGLWRFIKQSKDPSLYESLLEDCAALVGIGLAVAGVSASSFLGLLWADAAASIAIGVLLVLNAFVIGRATRSLIVGEAMATPALHRLDKALRRLRDRPYDLRTLHLGPRTVLADLCVTLDDGEDAAAAFAAMERALKDADDRVTWVTFRLAHAKKRQR